MDVDARLKALEAENDRLRDELDMLRSTFGVEPVVWPAEWRLTGKEGSVFGALMARDTCTKNQLMAALYQPGADHEPEIKIIDVFVCKLRKKLRPFGIEIETVWGLGYRMGPAAKAAAKAQMAGQAVAA